MILTLLLAPAIVISDNVTTRDSWCTKPETLQSQGYCARRIYQDEKFRRVDNGSHDPDYYDRILEMLDELDRRCANRRCR